MVQWAISRKTEHRFCIILRDYKRYTPFNKGEDIVHAHMKICLIYMYFTYQPGKANKILKSSLEPLSFLPNNSTNKRLGGYLAGLIEGDGSIIVPKTIRNQKGKLLYPVVKITFVKKDAPLAVKIQDIIRGGQIVHPKDSNYIDLLFQDLNSIQSIAVLLNGNMRTPKIEALYRLIDWLNAKYKDKPEIVKLGLDSGSLGSNP